MIAEQPIGIIFDLDGTMVDNKEYHKRAWIDVCARHGLVITEEKYYSQIHARTNDIILQNLFGPGITAEQWQIGIEKETAYRDMYRPYVKPIPGLLEFLSDLKTHNIPCAVASNSPVGNVDMVLDGLKIRCYFSAVITADDVTRGKPDPEIFHTAASRLGIVSNRCLIFEDSRAGFQAARNAGSRYIVITAGAFSTYRDEAGDAAAIHEDFTQLNLPALKSLLN